jgi:addiction module RelE/StbE family toxin
MKLSWTAEARQDRRAIFSYIRKDNPAAAADMDDEFVRAAAQLSRHPFSGRVGRVEDTRELLVHPSYLIIYDIKR